MYCIYRITNKLNNKTYIGQHKYKDLSTDKYIGSGKYLLRAISKYGIENFKREILISEIETREEIDTLERYYIKLERDSGHSEYNISDGGEGWNMSGINHYLYGKHIPEETRRKMSESNKGKVFSKESRLKMSKAKSGENHPMYGKYLSEETKMKISDTHKGQGNPMYGKSFSEEHRMNLSISKRGENHPFFGRHHSEESKERMSRSHRGENHPMYGKHLSDEFKKKLSESHKGKYPSEETRRKMSESAKLKVGKRYYNNGISCHMYIPGTEPEGYKLGKLPRI